MINHHPCKELELDQLMAFPSTRCYAWILVVFQRE
jgi:hypothetical protein